MPQVDKVPELVNLGPEYLLKFIQLQWLISEVRKLRLFFVQRNYMNTTKTLVNQVLQNGGVL